MVRYVLNDRLYWFCILQMILGMRVLWLWSEGRWFWWSSLKLTLKTLHESQSEGPSEFWLTSCCKENWESEVLSFWWVSLSRRAGDDADNRDPENIKLPSLLSVILHSTARLKWEYLIHTIEHVSVSARGPLLCHRCALLFLSQPSGSEKVGTLMCLPLISMLQLGVTLAHLKKCVCVRHLKAELQCLWTEWIKMSQ